MRDLRARAVVVGLILTFPALMVALNPRVNSSRAAALPLLAVETILVGGLAMAFRERGRLLAERSTPAVCRTAPRRLAAKAPHAAAIARPVRGAHAGRV